MAYLIPKTPRIRGLLSLSEISRTELLPLAYLEQLIGELRRAGLVEGVRGLHGGYRLTRGPSEITVGEVYRVLEGPIARTLQWLPR